MRFMAWISCTAVSYTHLSFDGSVTEEKGNAGHVDIMGEINRYGDNLTYPQENIENNVYDNGLKAVASFIDYVAGTNIPINSKDGKDAIGNASFLVKEPLPILKAENQYYNCLLYTSRCV